MLRSVLPPSDDKQAQQSQQAIPVNSPISPISNLTYSGPPSWSRNSPICQPAKPASKASKQARPASRASKQGQQAGPASKQASKHSKHSKPSPPPPRCCIGYSKPSPPAEGTAALPMK